MKKKSQIGEVFIYLISTLIIILVLYYGYNAIKGISEKNKELSFVKFQNALRDMVSYTSSDYGTVRIEEFYLPGGYTEVCFADKDFMSDDLSKISEQDYPLVYDSISQSVSEGRTISTNVFVLPGGSPFLIEKMKVDNKFFCTKVLQGKIKLRIEGKGDSALVMQP